MTKAEKEQIVARLRSYEVLTLRLKNITAEMETSKESKERLKAEYKEKNRMKAQIDWALALLSPRDRMVVQLMDINRERGNGYKLCQMLDCEIATIYKRRNFALAQMCQVLLGS